MRQAKKQNTKQNKSSKDEEGRASPVRLADVVKSTLRPFEMVWLEPMNYF